MEGILMKENGEEIYLGNIIQIEDMGDGEISVLTENDYGKAHIEYIKLDGCEVVLR
jgi:hypothetical protein